jgi:hypothetical protein
MLFDASKMGGMSVKQMVEAVKYYEACCTAEYGMENFEPVDYEMSDEDWINIGYAVRARMNDYDYCDGQLESDLIAEELERFLKEVKHGS